MALIVVDASVVIAFLDADDAHHGGAVEMLTANRNDTAVLPASAYAEVLVGPLKHGRAAGQIVDQALRDLAVDVVPVTREIAGRAAQLRASRTGLRLPDALVLATADVLDASAVLTADRAWQKVSRRVRLI